MHSTRAWPIWWGINILYVSLSYSSVLLGCAVRVTTGPSSCMWSCSLWLSNPADWFLVDQEDAGGEDGPRGGGARAWRGEHHRGGGEHLDCQPLRPPREDLESWATSKAGKECLDSLLSKLSFPFHLLAFPHSSSWLPLKNGACHVWRETWNS